MPSKYTKRPKVPSKTCFPIIQQDKKNISTDNCLPTTQICLPITKQGKSLFSNDTKNQKNIFVVVFYAFICWDGVVFFGEKEDEHCAYLISLSSKRTHRF
jgi:hypothetical protein